VLRVALRCPTVAAGWQPAVGYEGRQMARGCPCPRAGVARAPIRHRRIGRHGHEWRSEVSIERAKGRDAGSRAAPGGRKREPTPGRRDSRMPEPSVRRRAQAASRSLVNTRGSSAPVWLRTRALRLPPTQSSQGGHCHANSGQSGHARLRDDRQHHLGRVGGGVDDDRPAGSTVVGFDGVVCDPVVHVA